MATALYRLGRWCAAHSWVVIASWLVVLLGLGGAAATLSTPFTSEVKIKDTTFNQVIEQLGDKIPAARGGAGTVLFEAPDGGFTQEHKEAIGDVVDKWSEVDHVVGVANPFTTQADITKSAKDLASGQAELNKARTQLEAAKKQIDAGQKEIDAGTAQLDQLKQANPSDPRIAAIEAQLAGAKEQLAPGKKQYEEGLAELEAGEQKLAAGKTLAGASEGIQFISDDGRYAIARIAFDTNPQSLGDEVRSQIPEIGDTLKDTGLTVNYSGEIAQVMELVGVGEIIGLVFAAVVLIVMLGTLIAAGLPLLTAIMGVGVGLAGAVAATSLFTMHALTPSLALMLGLAVGIDYTLFIVNRHRTNLLSGKELHESIGRAIGTSGNAVVFAGLTVIIALVALLVSNIGILGQMGLVAAATVAATVLVSITLTPAVLSLMGRRVISKRGWAKADAAHPESEHGGWLVRFTTGHPWLTIVGTVLIVGLMAIPALNLRMGLPDGGSEPPDSTAFVTYSTVADQFGPGVNGPIIAVATLDQAPEDTLSKKADIAERLAAVEGVRNVAPFGESDDKGTLAFQIVPTTGPADAATVDVVDRLQDAKSSIGADTGATIGFTGATVANIEVSQKLSDALPGYLAIVVGLSLLILIGVFRSVIVPIVATGGFLLSVSAAFGAMVMVYQWGWAGEVFGVGQPGPIMSFAPIMIIGVLFGLAMDYQMFLVTGMREAYVHGEDARKAVKSGFMHGTKVVTAAALIMFSVFGGFVFAHMTMVRPIGLGLAVGVLVDAILVRQILTPAVMHLLGDKAWWIPGWLDKITPDVDVEGAKLTELLAASSDVEPSPADPEKPEASDDAVAVEQGSPTDVEKISTTDDDPGDNKTPEYAEKS